jgi:alanine racemase
VIVDLDAIRHNYRYLKQQAAGSRVIAVIKADAYGHGAVEVARALAGADAFAVATVYEAMQLRQAGVEQPMIILGGVIDQQEMQLAAEHDLQVVIHQDWQVDLLLAATRKLDIWFKFNSGMARLGFSAEDLLNSIQRLQRAGYRGHLRLMTHLANADSVGDARNTEQIARVEGLGLDPYEWGIANSAGTLAWPNAHRLWVRAGIALYGSDPLDDQSHARQLKPAMHFESQVLAIYQRHAGESIGYGSLYTLQQDETIAVVAAGYADGYPRHLFGGAVSINGQHAEVVGRVSMDMITVKVSGLQVEPGDPVVLWGKDPSATEVATRAETIPYELYCHAGCHGLREYLNKSPNNA